MSHIFEAVTHGISVKVRPVFLADHSDPAEAKYVWAYTIDVKNLSDQTVQLINRHWLITNALGGLEEVKGPGVIGKQPTLKPNEAFNYTSFCHLKTNSGFMRGTFEMQPHPTDLKGGTQPQPNFLIEIPTFSLDQPAEFQVLN
ncbi:MAG: Co2+/Mg2+ efflux protein ApaG [Alphaproteobacteria bacterium]